MSPIKHLNAGLLLLLLSASACWAIRPVTQEAKRSLKPPEDVNLRPLIGVLSQGGEPAPRGSSYIAASYVKFLEAAGARVVPILHDMNRAEVERRFRAINGVLIPGGAQDLRQGHPFYDTAALLFQLAEQANRKGDYFPIHGTCLGFETLAIIASGNSSILSDYDAEDYPAPLLPTEAAPKSRFFQAMPRQVYQDLTTQAYAMENHAHGLSLAAVRDSPALSKFFQVLTLSADRGGDLYVSTMESTDPGFPVLATQWHPEKNAFEWTRDKNIPHEPAAIAAAQATGNYVVSLARRSRHRPADDREEQELLIYNWDTTYTGKRKWKGEEVDFEQVYVFPDADSYLREAARRVAKRLGG